MKFIEQFNRINFKTIIFSKFFLWVLAFLS